MEASGKGPVLIETSVWIDVVRGRPGNMVRPVTHLMRARRAAIAGLCVAELLGGMRPHEEQGLRTLLDGLRVLSDPPDLWWRTGDLIYGMRRRGVTLFVPDATIAVIALVYDMPLFTLDADFAGVPGLRLWDPKAP